MGRIRLYICCKNGNCPGDPNGNNSWRYLDSGPPNCRFCNARFDVSERGSKGNFAEKGNKPAKTSKQQHQQESTSHERFIKALKEELSEDDDKRVYVDAIQDALQHLYPGKPRSEAELRKDAIDKVERSYNQLLHQNKVLEQMQTSLANRAAEYLEYEGKVELQKTKLQEAKEAHDQAKQDHLKFDSSNAASAAPAASYVFCSNAVGGGIKEILSKLLPEGFDTGLASTIGQEICQLITSPPPPPQPQLPPKDQIHHLPTNDKLAQAVWGDNFVTRQYEGDDDLFSLDEDVPFTDADDRAAREKRDMDQSAEEEGWGVVKARRRRKVAPDDTGDGVPTQELLDQAKLSASANAAARATPTFAELFDSSTAPGAPGSKPKGTGKGKAPAKGTAKGTPVGTPAGAKASTLKKAQQRS